MNTLDLQTFACVAKHGAMKRAAIELRTVQSNVTARIRGLEAELGVSLFDRTSRGVKLTRAGECLMPYALEAARVLGAAHSAVKGQVSPPLRIAGAEALTTPLLSGGLSALTRRFPQIEVSVTSSPRRDMLRSVLATECDAALVLGPVEHAGLAYEAIAHQPLLLVARSPLPSADRMFAGAPARFILPDHEGVSREHLARWAVQQGARASCVVHVTGVAQALACAEQGLGSAVLPSAAAHWGASRFHVHTRALPHEFGVIMGLVERRGEKRSAAMEAFLQGVIEQAKSLAGPSQLQAARAPSMRAYA